MACPATYLRSVVDRDGTVILDIEHDAIVTLNSTGSYVWDRLQRGKLVDDIVFELAAETGVDIALVDLDVRVFLEQLMSKHLLAD
jgi:hypothetical protein